MTRILLAEDDILSIRLMEYLLTSAGYTLDTVSDGQRAIQYLYNQEPDLLILDIQLPVIDGLQVCHIARERYPTLPILVVTGVAKLICDPTPCYEAGANAFVAKPFERDTLLSRIQALITG